jgi:hypothetical protein
MGNFFTSIWHYLSALGMAFGAQLKTGLTQFLKAFPLDDLGKLAVDAVSYVESSIPGETDVVKRTAAIEKFKTDATAAGHDLSGWATSLFNFFIETALQVFLSQVA